MKGPGALPWKPLTVGQQLSGLLATEFNDLGDRRAARVSWASARRAADASGDRDLRVWVRAKQADDLRWAGWPARVVGTLADEAVGIAASSPSYGLFRAQTVRAWLAAKAADTSGARGALEDFTRTFENLPQESTAPDAASGLVEAGLGEAFLCWHRADLLTHIRDGNAVEMIEQAAALYPAEISGPIVLLQLMRAADLVRTRDVGQGIAHALDAIQAGPMSAARRHLVGQVLACVPEQSRALPAVRNLRALSVVAGH